MYLWMEEGKSLVPGPPLEHRDMQQRLYATRAICAPRDEEKGGICRSRRNRGRINLPTIFLIPTVSPHACDDIQEWADLQLCIFQKAGVYPLCKAFNSIKRNPP